MEAMSVTRSDGSQSASLQTGARVLSRWLVGDVVYAVLPIIVLAAVTLVLSRPFDHFTEIKEWSFATIVFFGLTIRRFVRIKTEIQQRPNSYKVDTGIQLFVVGLVGAVCVLVLVVLSEIGAFAGVAVRYLGVAQVGFFCAGLFSLLISICAEEFGPRMGVGAQSQAENLERSYWHVTNAVEHMEKALETIEHISWETMTPGEGREARNITHLSDVLIGAIGRVGDLGTIARNKAIARPGGTPN